MKINTQRYFATLLAALSIMFGGLLNGDSAETAHPILKIVNMSPESIEMRIVNTSAFVIRTWKETNSWGIARWRLLILRQQTLLTFYQENDSILSLDTPAYTEIPAGKSISVDVNLKSPLWHGENDSSVILIPGDTVILIYEVPALTEGGKLHVWHGTIATVATFSK